LGVLHIEFVLCDLVACQGIAMDYSDPPEVTPTAVTYSFAESLSFGFLEDSQPRVLTRFDSLSATMQWTAVGSPASFEATIFRGALLLPSPFAVSYPAPVHFILPQKRYQLGVQNLLQLSDQSV
jgi:hypothetical protein